MWIVVTGDQLYRTQRIALADALKAFGMRVEEAGHEKTGSADMREQPRDDVGIVDEIRERWRGLQTHQQRAKRL